MTHDIQHHAPALACADIDINFRYVDRSFKGTITFGQFLACYANFLISHARMHGNSKPKPAVVLEDLDDDLLSGPLR